MEQDLEIVNTNKKDKQGNDIKNLNLKTRVNKATGEVSQGLKVGNYIVVEKVFAKGYENKKSDYSFFACKVKYKDEECSFLLSEKEHEDYELTGGMGDKIKIILTQYSYKHKDVDKTALKLTFELVE